MEKLSTILELIILMNSLSSMLKGGSGGEEQRLFEIIISMYSVIRIASLHMISSNSKIKINKVFRFSYLVRNRTSLLYNIFFMAKVNSRCFCYPLSAILMSFRGAQIGHFYTELYKFLGNFLRNISALGNCTGLRLRQVVCWLIFYNTAFFLTLPIHIYPFRGLRREWLSTYFWAVL